MESAVAEPKEAEATEAVSQPLKAIQSSVETYLGQCLAKDVEHNNLYQDVLNVVQLPLLQVVLKETHGNQSRAAKILGVSRGTLRKFMYSHQLLQPSDQVKMDTLNIQ